MYIFFVYTFAYTLGDLCLPGGILILSLPNAPLAL